MCGRRGCYRRSASYRRWAIDLFPERCRGRIEIARFECRKARSTFSLLPTQLIPYHQYTLHAVVFVVLLGMRFWEGGEEGARRASRAVDNDSDVTPWLVLCWLGMVTQGLWRAHAELCRYFDLSEIVSDPCMSRPWAEVGQYMRAVLGRQGPGWSDRIVGVAAWYSTQTGAFLFGVPSQQRPKRRV